MNKARTTVSAVLIFIAALACFTRIAAADNGTAQEVFDPTELMFIGEEKYLVTIASRKAEPLRRAPAAATIIQGDELRRYRTLAEALRSVPGFFIDRNELKERVYLRGIPDSFLVMMDGVPFSSDASTGDYPRGMELSLDYIDKIEIIRGPGSSLWGPDAFSGIVNLVTKKGRHLQGVALKAETGSYDTRDASLQAGFEKHGWDAYVFGSAADTEGFETDLSGTNRRRRDDRYAEVYGRASYKDVFEISGRYSRYRDYYTEPTFLLEGSETKSFSFMQATFNKTLHELASKPTFSTRAWFQYFDSLDDYDTSRYEQHNRQYGIEAAYDQRLFEQHYVTAGISFRYNEGSKTKFKYHDQTYTYFPSYFNHLISFYFQDKWKLLDNLEITGGLRYDNHSEYDRFWSPRLGINYLFAEHFNLKLLYGRAFRTPSLVVLIEESGLRPEQIDSYEVELGFQYQDLFSIEANYFYNELDNLIERNALGEINNRGNDHIKGLELAARWRPSSRLTVYASYSRLFGNRQRGTRTTQTIQSPDDPNQTIESTVESFFNVAPDSTLSCGADLTLFERLRLNLELNYVDSRRLARGDTGLYGSRHQLGSYLIADLNIFLYDIPFKNTEIALKIKNLFDRDYKTRGVFGLVESEGSSMYLTLRYRF